MMERLSTVSQPVRQKRLGKEKDVDEKNENGKLLAQQGTTGEGNFEMNAQDCFVICPAIMGLVSRADERTRWTFSRFVTLSAVSLQQCNLTLPVTLYSSVSTGQDVMAGEALGRRNIWEPSVYYALGKESFYFAGHDVSIHESLDTFGALIWPGVRPYTTASAHILTWLL